MRRANAFVVAIAALSLGACSLFSSRDSGPQMAPLPEITPSVKLDALWQADVGSSQQSVFSPALAGNSVYAAAADGTIVRLDAANGKQLWRINAGESLTGGVGAGDGLVAVGTDKGDVLVFDDHGTALWKARVSSEVLAAPRIAQGLVVVRSADSRIFGLNAKDGKRKWYYQRATPVLTVRSPVGITVSDGVIYAGFAGGKLVAISLADGAVRWEATVALPRGTTELERVTDVIGLPVIAGREVCAVAYQGRIGCFDQSSGQALWGRELSSSSGLALDAHNAYVSDDKGAVLAMERSSGISMWRQGKLSYRNLSAPLALGKEVAVADVQGYVYLLDPDSGAFVGLAETDGSAVSTPPVRLPGGGFLVQTRKGGLYAFKTR